MSDIECSSKTSARWLNIGFGVSTLLFMMPWQFAQFAIFTQVRNQVRLFACSCIV